MTVTEITNRVTRWVEQEPQMPFVELQKLLIDTHEMEEKLAMCHIMVEFKIVDWMNQVTASLDSAEGLNKEFIIADIQTAIETELEAARESNHDNIMKAGYGMLGLDSQGNTIAASSDTHTTGSNGQNHYNPGQYGQAGFQGNQSLPSMARASAGNIMFGMLSRVAGVPPPGSSAYGQQQNYTG